MAHRNRWFTELKNGGFFHGELLNNQIITYWIWTMNLEQLRKVWHLLLVFLAVPVKG